MKKINQNNITNTVYCNVFKNLKTTIIGLAIISLSLYSIFSKETIAWTDILLPILFGIILVLSPDSIIQVIKQYLKK